ncbi:MAG: NUDIX domain-containing protein [Dehalococcoidia bacterium]|jgi:8-oxo-dGTP pyrophosphatase MutT (NUDIX family)|nr:NUDIX domain-containing protein [Dehalococcoidia bacterium]|tara:strand:+ start:31 stop:498 length:468 start_codon:yes stop_codon:yes gene_type:complete
MATMKFGERVGREGVLRPGASGLIFDADRERILLTRREDNGRWCLPGGGMDAGESAKEACVREMLEETGLEVRVTKLIGIYTTPDILMEYPDGNRIQPVAFSFEAEITGGELGLSDEVTEFGWYTVKEMESMDILEHHVPRIRDGIENQPEAFIK